MCETTDTKPNIFKYATKELSQDAVICWLIDWARSNVKQEHEPLKQCGQKFTEVLFAKHGKEVPKNLGEVTVWQQYNNIDVLVDVGDYVLLIEDKIDGKPDKKQLTGYYDQVVQMVEDGTVLTGKRVENILPIFLKTGNHSLYEQVIEVEHFIPPYKVFDRGDFLEVVEPYSAAHPLLEDFTARLKCWERAMKSFEGWNQDEQWEWRSIEGFFRELENHLTVFDSGFVGFDNHPGIAHIMEENNWRRNSADNPWWGWGWVNPPAGGSPGFYCFSWYGKKFRSNANEVRLYLQLEINPNNPDARKLCFKVSMDEVDVNIKWDCHARILEAGRDLVRAPDRMGHGYTVTIAEWTSPWLVFKSNGGPDIPAIVKNLMEAQTILDRVEDIGDAV